MSDAVSELADPKALSAYLEGRLPGEGGLAVERHQAGHSNETFFLQRGSAEWVLRRPPLGAFLPTAHDVAREYRVLDALKDTPVRVPRVLLMCEDDSVIGAPFYVMERIRGVVVRSSLPDAFTEEHRAAIGHELVDALVELHAVDPASCGLEGFGKPSGYLERQLRRWKGQLELTLPFTRPLPDLERVGEWLHGHAPRSQDTTIVHGDYKLDNVMFDSDLPVRLIALLDWEMSTLGDPLADLGWMISFWREPSDPEDDVFARTTRVTELPGFASRADLTERYASATGRDVSELSWYRVLAIWKLAILLEGSYARHLAGMTDDPFFAEMERGVPSLASYALDVADAGS
ncbi:MAG: phosphotransferase family protein [Actinomycetota bacterium]|nr:phosphotransferase family protein [Actinomycetota bacterium]